MYTRIYLYIIIPLCSCDNLSKHRIPQEQWQMLNQQLQQIVDGTA